MLIGPAEWPLIAFARLKAACTAEIVTSADRANRFCSICCSECHEQHCTEDGGKQIEPAAWQWLHGLLG
jgi:hypothetical protein